jgi:serine/threonine protein kinase/tetratricopeptide (TPR) repeat protein
MIGSTISHYKILEKLGGGGMGVVYKAQDLKLDRFVALKFLPPQFGADEEEKRRFIHEAKAASALDHSNICTIHEIDETPDGQLFIVMAYYKGQTLKKKIERGPLQLGEAIDITIQVAQGLAEAHEHGILHRDIKPANVMVTTDGVAKVVDFGLAKLAGQTVVTKTGTTVGTVAYMAPEQALGEKLDQRTDIWSLGAVLYEMLTGKVPFPGDYEQAIMYRILNEEPEPITSLRSNVPMELEHIVKKAVQKDRSHRYQQVNELLADLRLLKKEVESGKSVEPPKQAARPKIKRLYLYVSVIVVAAAFVVGGLLLLHGPKEETIDSIAVLPLENLSQNPEQEYFADGMTEALITELSKIRALKVTSRTSVMQYKDARKPVPLIGRELGVKAVIEGSVMRSGGKVRITAQLIRAASDEHLWAESFDRDLSDVLALSSDMARLIAGKVRVALTPSEEARLSAHRPVIPEAYEAFLKGRYHWNKRTAEESKKAVEYFNQAIEKDPSYALAYAGLAETYVLFPEYAGLPGKEYFPRAEAAARRALGLDENLAEAHSVLGLVNLQYAWDWSGAEREFKKAIELNPNYPTAHHWYNIMLVSVGRLDEAMNEIKRAQELDPLSLIINQNIGVVLYFKRRYDEAIEQYKKTLELDQNFAGTHFCLGIAYCQKGMFAEAIAEYQKVRLLVGSGPYGLGPLGCVYARSGRVSEAQHILNQLLAFSKQGYVVSYGIALVYNGLGVRNAALQWLERACEEHDRFVVDIKVEPVWDNLRSDVRFKALLQKMGLGK